MRARKPIVLSIVIACRGRAGGGASISRACEFARRAITSIVGRLSDESVPASRGGGLLCLERR